MMAVRRSSSGTSSSPVSGAPETGQTEPRVRSHSSIVSRSNTRPAGVRTGSRIRWPLISQRSSAGTAPAGATFLPVVGEKSVAPSADGAAAPSGLAPAAR